MSFLFLILTGLNSQRDDGLAWLMHSRDIDLRESVAVNVLVLEKHDLVHFNRPEGKTHKTQQGY